MAAEDEARDVVKGIKEHPAISIAAVVVIGLGLYYLAKKGPGAGGNAPSAANPSGTAQGSYYVAYLDEEPSPVTTINNYPGTGTNPAPPGQPTTTGGGNIITARTRGSQPITAAWDSKYNGVPVRSSPGSITSYTKIIPFGQQITITGSPVTAGGNISKGSGSNLWYPISGGGWISQFDIGSITSNPPSTNTGRLPGPVTGTLQPLQFAGR